MELAAFLEREEGGFIRLSGHRIGLHHLVRLYREGYSPEMLAEEFPTLPLALIHKTIAFYLENEAEVDSFAAAEERDSAARGLSVKHGIGPANRVRTRLRDLRRAKAG